MVSTHFQTVVSHFEGVRTCTCHRTDTPLFGNTDRRAKEELNRTNVNKFVVKVDVRPCHRSSSELSGGEMVAVEDEDDRGLAVQSQTDDGH